MYSLSDLDALRGTEAHATYLDQVKTRKVELNQKFDGKPFDEEARAEFQDLIAIEKKTETIVAELRARDQMLVEAAQDDRRSVSATYPAVNVRNSSQSRVPENIFDLSGYATRSAPDSPQYGQALRDGAMKAIERAAYPNPQSKPDVEQTHISRNLDTIDTPDRKFARRILVTGSPEYSRAFYEYIRTGVMEQRFTNVLAQTDAQGGFALPFHFDPTILHVGAWTSINPYRQACKVVPIVGTDTYNGVTATAVAATRTTEAAASVESGPATWAQINAICGRVQSMVTVSIEFMQDRADATAEIAQLIAEAKDTEEESIFSIGVGATPTPIGMFATHGTAGAYSHVDMAAAHTVAIGDLYNVEAGVPIRSRMNAAWFMSRAAIRAFQALETTGGQLFNGTNYAKVGYPVNSPTGNTGLTLLMYPIYETPSAPYTPLVDDTPLAWLGDPKSFLIVERVGMNIEVIPHIFGAAQGNLPTGQRGIYAIWRNTAKPADTNAGRQYMVLNA